MLPPVRFRLGRDVSFDAAQFCRLFNSLYTRRVDERYFRWQFFQSPCPSGIAVAELHDGTWAGCYGFHVFPAANIPRPLVWAIDIMVATEFQRNGLFGQLATFAAAEVSRLNPAALCVMANAKSECAHVHSLAWRRVALIPTYARATADAPEPSREFSIGVSGPLNTLRYASLAARSPNPLVHQVRSAPYLRWRFTENPWYRYTEIVVYRAGSPLAAALVKTFRDPISAQTYGDIVDVVWSQDDCAALRELLCAALRHFREAGVATAATWFHTNSVLDTVGASLGFHPSSQVRHFCCHTLGPEFAGLQLDSNWSLSMSASEIY